MPEIKNYRIVDGYQRTTEWFYLREGMITGSTCKNVLGTGDAFLYETLEVMTIGKEHKEIKGVASIDRGVELEPEAKEEYGKAMGIKVSDVCFIINGRYGLSPDGLIYKAKKLVRTIEVKCPDSKTHIRYIIENKIPKEHRAQVVHNFIVLDDLEELDFVSYDPRFIHKPLHIIKIKRSELLLEIQTAEIAYQKFIEKVDANYPKLII